MGRKTKEQILYEIIHDEIMRSFFSAKSNEYCFDEENHDFCLYYPDVDEKQCRLFNIELKFSKEGILKRCAICKKLFDLINGCPYHP